MGAGESKELEAVEPRGGGLLEHDMLLGGGEAARDVPAAHQVHAHGRSSVPEKNGRKVRWRRTVR